ncbi:hypothetical protein WN51_12813 [Melipona quadrifasciata]|uniref:Uncharacterized protein n=1 Tax=Melipona quadrifasciata TaxID=166423 RepID=A0A0N0U5P7_9HYME|nr:hypothetical protein WN51_12813 [Melipona quadrifasciata]
MIKVCGNKFERMRVIDRMKIEHDCQRILFEAPPCLKVDAVILARRWRLFVTHVGINNGVWVIQSANVYELTYDIYIIFKKCLSTEDVLKLSGLHFCSSSGNPMMAQPISATIAREIVSEFKLINLSNLET